MKIIKNIPLMALVFGLGFMTVMMSFKGDRVMNTYYYDQGDNTWKPLTRIFDNTLNEELEYDENSYQCLENEEKFCTGEFDSSDATIPGTAEPDGSSILGDYFENPEPDN